MKRKTALVLSAGGMFGAYQAGVWRKLAEGFQPDMVIGASVGALNGWCIASRCGTEELEDRWRDPSAGELVQFRRERGARAIWRNGLFESARLQAGADILFNSYLPRIPFGLVMVEVPGLRRRLVQTPDVRPHHIVASCSIPFLYPFVNIGGKHFTDGACLEGLPLWAAAAMGATEIVAVDCMQRVTPWWVHAGAAGLRFISGSRPIPKRLQVTMISPSELLGNAADAVVWKRDNIESWLQLGARDADRVMNGAAAQKPAVEIDLTLPEAARMSAVLEQAEQA